MPRSEVEQVAREIVRQGIACVHPDGTYYQTVATCLKCVENTLTTFAADQVQEAEKQVQFSNCQICGKRTASVCTICASEQTATVSQQQVREAERPLIEIAERFKRADAWWNYQLRQIHAMNKETSRYWEAGIFGWIAIGSFFVVMFIIILIVHL